jgi:hypothetical protein
VLVSNTVMFSAFMESKYVASSAGLIPSTSSLSMLGSRSLIYNKNANDALLICDIMYTYSGP